MSMIAAVLILSGAASDPIAVYGVVERVVFEPSDEKPERVQVWGAFRVAKGKFGNDYESPARGYLYFCMNPNFDAKLQLQEWKDLKKVAGSGEGVGFGTRYQGTRRVRPEGAPAKDPDAYMIGYGMAKTGDRHGLGRMPAAASPAEGAEVDAGRVTLRARNVLDPKAAGLKYFFEITGPDGSKERSEGIGAGEKETFWTPKLEVKAGAKYAWQVWVEDGEKKMGPVSSASFTGKK